MNQIQQISTKAIIRKEGKVLLIKDPKGLWELPGGRINFGETPSQTLRREIKEELGLTISDISAIIDVQTFCTSKVDTEKQYLLLFFECGVDNYEIVLDHESIAFEWADLSSINEYPMRDVYINALLKLKSKSIK